MHSVRPREARETGWDGQGWLCSCDPGFSGTPACGANLQLEALLEGEEPKEGKAANLSSIYKEEVWYLLAAPSGPRCNPGWHLCFCLGKAGQAFAQSPNHGGDGNWFLTRPKGVRAWGGSD